MVSPHLITPPISLIGRRFTRLVVREMDGEYRGSRTRWICDCDCGQVKSLQQRYLTRKPGTQSCGCLQRERSGKYIRHGHAAHNQLTRPYRAWKWMRARCYNPHNNRYHRYGGRGRTVCDRWRYSCENFYADMGDPPPGLTLERKNNSLGYSPENCCWAENEVQANNTNTNRFITFRGETLTMAQWDRKLGFPPLLIQKRLRRGWTRERALTTPVDTRRRRKR